MSIATLNDVLSPALQQGYAVAGLVVLGWEDALAYVEAAEMEGVPVILQAGPGCRKHTPLAVLGPMFRYLAEQAKVPVVCHLDHGNTLDECWQALDCGFSSIMFDGSRKSLAENIDLTATVVERAHAVGVSVEGEIGFVGYAEGEASNMTDAQEAASFASASGIDAIAISVGNVHLQQDKATQIDLDTLRAIEAVTDIPLVLHGGSGIPAENRRWLAQNSNIYKFNIGTELRMAFGQSLRQALNNDPKRFDRIAILKDTINPVREATCTIIGGLGTPTKSN